MSSNVLPVPHEWTNVTVTVDRDGMAKMYFNSVLVAEEDFSLFNVDLINTRNTEFGSYYNLCFNGSLDEIKIYSKVLSENEIRQIVNTSGKVYDWVEIAALRDIFTTTVGGAWNNSSNWLNSTSLSDVENWYGVTTDSSDVTGINLSNNNLTNALPSSIGDLKSITEINLNNNALGGGIPSTLGAIDSLTVLDLGNNGISGYVPEELGQLTYLTELNLQDNDFIGEVPGELAGLNNLTVANFSGNSILGIPSFNNASNLSLTVSENKLDFADLEAFFDESGHIFSDFSYQNQAKIGLGRIEYLIEDDPIEIEVLNQGNYSRYQWQKKDSSGIWQNIANENDSIFYIEESTMPDSGDYKCIVTNDRVTGLSLETNIVTYFVQKNEGLVPDHIEYAAMVEFYESAQGSNWIDTTNWLTGTTVIEMGTWLGVKLDAKNRDIRVIRLPNNNLFGSMQSSLCNLKGLEVLDLSGNEGYHGIPNEIGNLSNLDTLNLRNCWISGRIPEKNFGNLINLSLLDLTSTGWGLSGEFPEGFNMADSMAVFNIQNNEIGSLPNFNNKESLIIHADTNRLNFGDLEPYFSGTDTIIIDELTYSNQDKREDERSIGRTIGAEIDIRADFEGGSYTNYDWQKKVNGEWVSIDYPNDNYYRLDSFILEDEGDYRCVLTNDLITDLTLERHVMTLNRIYNNHIVGQWTFDNHNADDESGADNHGINVGAVLTDGHLGEAYSAYSFNGVDKYIDIKSDNGILNMYENYSISFWFKQNGPPGGDYHAIYQRLNEENKGIIIYILEDGTFGFFKKPIDGNILAVNYYNSDYKLMDNEWHHFVITHKWGEGNYLKMYVDNYLVGTFEGSTFSSFRDPVIHTFGKLNDEGIMNGCLDDVTIYDRELQQSEITREYVTGSSQYLGNDTEPKNWTESKVFDKDGNIVAHSKSYTSNLGKIIQTQSANLSENKAIIAQTIYDELGRPAVSTLPAALDNNGLDYKPGFITNIYGYDFTYTSFTGSKLDYPDVVNWGLQNSLGWYYSDYNNVELYTPATTLPYMQTEYSKITGKPRRSTLAGKHHRMGSGNETRTYTMPASGNELNALDLRVDISRENEGLTKVITTDAEGKTYVSFLDEEGNKLGVCETDGTKERVIPSMLVVATSPKIPASTQYLDIYLSREQDININSEYVESVVNLETDEIVPLSNPMPAGIYRIRSKNTEYDLPFSYEVYYSDDAALNTYDKLGRLKESYSPLAYGALDSSLKSTFEYNSAGWLLESSTPDEGTTKYKYRLDGRVSFTQNEQQKEEQVFSFSEYDNSGRIIEVGEFVETGSIYFDHIDGDYNLPAGERRDITNYEYDYADTSLNQYGLYQKFTSGNLSKTSNTISTTWYSYTYDGKVEWIARDIIGLGLVTVDYEYDFNGNIEKVIYEKDNYLERFDHVYTYDANLRLSEVKTIEYNDDGTIKEENKQAKYAYYAHGPLKRIELDENLQGIDYVYNINGWLKTINHPSLNSNDPGMDGNNEFYSDIFGQALDYYNGDYTKDTIHISSSVGNSYYDGKISANRWKAKNAPFDSTLSGTAQRFYTYSYDHKNYLSGAQFGTFYPGGSSYDNYTGWSVDNIKYDENGNLLNLRRYALGDRMDDFSYNYNDGTRANQLTELIDHEADIEVDSTLLGDMRQGTHKFTYNKIGQMTSKKLDTIAEFYKYDAYGLVTGVYSDSLYTWPIVEYEYDDLGYRVKKISYVSNPAQVTYYMRDAGGNLLSTYTKIDDPSYNAAQTELPIYGAERLGVLYKNYGAESQDVYELTDHLGNVRATVGRDETDSIEVYSYADYYPFGMPMPGRQVTTGNYRFGYQGQFAEFDQEINQNQFEARLWDAWIGRWTAPDPAGQFYSPYLGMGNNPISYVDPDGMWSGPTGGGLKKFIGNFPGFSYCSYAGGSRVLWLGLSMPSLSDVTSSVFMTMRMIAKGASVKTIPMGMYDTYNFDGSYYRPNQFANELNYSEININRNNLDQSGSYIPVSMNVNITINYSHKHIISHGSNNYIIKNGHIDISSLNNVPWPTSTRMGINFNAKPLTFSVDAMNTMVGGKASSYGLRIKINGIAFKKYNSKMGSSITRPKIHKWLYNIPIKENE